MFVSWSCHPQGINQEDYLMVMQEYMICKKQEKTPEVAIHSCAMYFAIHNKELRGTPIGKMILGYV